MRRAFLKSALAAAVLGPGACTHRDDAQIDPALEAFAAFIMEQRAANSVPALSVGVANRAGVVTIVQSGVRDVGNPVPVQRNDLYHQGSITKSMTATMIARLVERGMVRWDSRIADIWPERTGDIHPALASVTLEMILRHRAGFIPMESDEEVAIAPSFSGDPRAVRAAFAQWLTSRAPRSAAGEHVYSNAGYGVAAAMAERAADAPWEALMRRELFAPLHMRSAGFGWPPEGQPRGHRYEDGQFKRHDWSDGYRLPPFIAPAGDVYASTADMLAYGRAHLAGPGGGAPMLRPETWRKLHDAPIDDYALGWNVRDFGIHHLGSAGTFYASLIVAPARDIVVHTVVNASGFPDGDQMVSTIASRAFRDFAVSSQSSSG